MELEAFGPRVGLFPLPVISPIIPNVMYTKFALVCFFALLSGWSVIAKENKAPIRRVPTYKNLKINYSQGMHFRVSQNGKVENYFISGEKLEELEKKYKINQENFSIELVNSAGSNFTVWSSTIFAPQKPYSFSSNTESIYLAPPSNPWPPTQVK